MAADPQEIRRRIAEQIGLAEPENRAPRRVFFRGRYLEFPPDTSDEEIEQTLRAPASQFLHVSEARGVPAPLLADLVERLQDVPLADFVAGGLLEALRKRALGMQVSPAEAGAAAADLIPGAALGIRILGRRPLYRGVRNPEERELALREGIVRGEGSAELRTPGTSTSLDPMVSMRPGFSGVPEGAELEVALELMQGRMLPRDIPIFRVRPEARNFPLLVADVDPVNYFLRQPVPEAGPGIAALSKPNRIFSEAEVFFRRDVPQFVQPSLRAEPLERDELVTLLKDRGAVRARLQEADELLTGTGDPVISRYKVYDPEARVAAGAQIAKEAISRVARYRGERIPVLESIAGMIRAAGAHRGVTEQEFERLASIPVGKDLTFGDLWSAAGDVIDTTYRVHDLWNVMKMANSPAQAIELASSAYAVEPEKVVDRLLVPAFKKHAEAYQRLERVLQKVDLAKARYSEGGERIKEAYDAFVRTKVRGLRQRRGKASADRRAR